MKWLWVNLWNICTYVYTYEYKYTYENALKSKSILNIIKKLRFVPQLK